MLTKKIHFARSLVIASLAVFLSGPALANWSAPPAASITRKVIVPARPSATTGTPLTTAPIPSSEAEQYASRESTAKPLEGFLGGERGIYIGTTALVIALLVVLIIVLI